MAPWIVDPILVMDPEFAPFPVPQGSTDIQKPLNHSYIFHVTLTQLASDEAAYLDCFPICESSTKF